MEASGGQMLVVGLLTDLGNTMFCKKKGLNENCRMGRRIVVMKLICSLSHCECNGHREHKFSQRRLTADWLAPREGDCSRMRSKVSSDWLPSYIKAMRPVLEIFKMAGYFPDTRRICMAFSCSLSVQGHGQMKAYYVKITGRCMRNLCAAVCGWRDRQVRDARIETTDTQILQVTSCCY